MDRKIICLSVVLFLLGAGIVVSSQENLVPNGSFEVDKNNDGIPDGWVIQKRRGNPTIILDKEVFHSGKQSVKFEDIGADFGILYYSTLHIDSLAGKKIDIRFWMKTENVGGKIVFYFNINDEGWKKVKQITLEGLEGTNDWTLVEKKGIEVPTAAAKVEIYIYASNVYGNCWIDDVEAIESGDSGTATVGEKKDLVANPAGIEIKNPFRIVRKKPLFQELLSDTPGGYKVHSWNHDITTQKKKELA